MSKLLSACLPAAMIPWLVLGCGGAPQMEMAPGEKLELKYVEVQDLVYKTKSFTTTNYKGFAQDAMTENEFTTSLDSIYADGSIVRRVTFDEYSQVTYSGGQAIFDPEAKMIEGESLWLKVGATGEIIDWRGLEGVRSYNSEDRNLRETIVQGMALNFMTLPDGPVGAGDTWTQEVTMDIGVRQGSMSFAVTNTYELLGITMKNGRKCARIGVMSDLVGTGHGEDPGRKYRFDMDVQGEGKGEIAFGLEEGYLVFSHEEVNLETEHRSVRGREEEKTEFFSAKIESEVVLVD